MQSTITARHCEVSDPLRARAVSVVERLGNLAGSRGHGSSPFQGRDGVAASVVRVCARSTESSPDSRPRSCNRAMSR